MKIVVEAEVKLAQVDLLLEKIKKHNRRAVRCGKPELEAKLTVGDPRVKEEEQRPDPNAAFFASIGMARRKKRRVVVCDVVLEYEGTLRMNGWKILARLEAISAMGEVSIIPMYSPDSSPDAVCVIDRHIHGRRRLKCDHCKKNVFRGKSFVLVNEETGEVIEVGSTCIEVFCGIDPKWFVEMAECGCLLTDIDSGTDEDGWYSDGNNAYREGLDTTVMVMTISAAIIEKFGWCSNAAAQERGLTATRDLVNAFMSPRRDPKIDWPTLEDRHEELAVAANEWWMTVTPKSTYEDTCKRLATVGVVPVKFIGYAASMTNAYKRHDEERKAPVERKPSEWIGKPGDRMVFVGKVVYDQFIETDFGRSLLFIIDCDGNTVKGFYSGGANDVIEAMHAGNLVKVKATVKKHDIYKEKKNTLINRPVLISVEERDEEKVVQKTGEV